METKLTTAAKLLHSYKTTIYDKIVTECANPILEQVQEFVSDCPAVDTVTTVEEMDAYLQKFRDWLDQLSSRKLSDGLVKAHKPLVLQSFNAVILDKHAQIEQKLLELGVVEDVQRQDSGERGED